jgi:hypothetical protein
VALIAPLASMAPLALIALLASMAPLASMASFHVLCQVALPFFKKI